MNLFVIEEMDSSKAIQFNEQKILPLLFKIHSAHKEVMNNSIELALICDSIDIANNLLQMICRFKLIYYTSINLLNGNNIIANKKHILANSNSYRQRK